MSIEVLMGALSVVLSAFSCWFARVAAKRALLVKGLLAHANASQDMRRCYTMAVHVRRAISVAGKEVSEQLINDLHDEVLALAHRHAAVMGDVESKALATCLETCKGALIAYRSGCDFHQVIDALRFVSSKCLAISERHAATVDRRLEVSEAQGQADATP